MGGSVGIALDDDAGDPPRAIPSEFPAAYLTDYKQWRARTGVARGRSCSAAVRRWRAGSHGRLLRACTSDLKAQAGLLAYIDAFWAMAVLCACVVPLVFMMKKSDPSRGIVIG